LSRNPNPTNGKAFLRPTVKSIIKVSTYASLLQLRVMVLFLKALPAQISLPVGGRGLIFSVKRENTILNSRINVQKVTSCRKK
jgi:hypothetical protein